MSIFDGPYLVVEVRSPVLIKIRNRRKDTIVHDDKLKPCDARVIPLWLRQKRQELTDLNETIAYDEAEQSILDAPNIDTLFPDNNTDTQDKETDILSDNIDQMLADNDVVSGSMPEATPSTQVTTRVGRRTKPNSRYTDYEM